VRLRLPGAQGGERGASGESGCVLVACVVRVHRTGAGAAAMARISSAAADLPSLILVSCLVLV